jgi:bifunctional DNA primase/polymerase-like protein/AAA domain-containing protein
MSTNLAVALELASAGIAVFPAGVWQARSGKWQKKPLFEDWQQSATTDREQIRHWWARHPNAVPGIWCGHPDLNFIMLDPDRHGGPDGVEAFAQLVCEEVGELPPHPTTQTAGGGFHHIFCQPDGAPIGNQIGKLPAGIDVRGKGGWFVAPGAVRHDGAIWRALDGTPPLTQAFRDRAIPKLCDKLAAIIRAPRQNGANGATPLFDAATATTKPNVWCQQASARERAFAAAALTNLSTDLASTAPGQRNRMLYDCAFRLATMIARGWIDRMAVANALWASCRANGLSADDGDDSVQATLASAFKGGTACPHPDLEDRDREEPHVEMPGADERANNRRATLNIVVADELEMRGVNWLWPGRFALGKIGLIAGLPDMGKGQIAAFLAAVVTTILELPCNEGAAPQGNVIWFNAEDDARDTVKPRLIAAGADPKRVHFVNSTQINGADKSFSLVTDLPLLREAIKKIGNVVLIIIDPMSAYLGVGKVDGRSATDVRGVLTPLKEMAEELHVAVIGIAHFNKKDDIKSALLRVSDSIAYVAAARHVYAVLDDPEDKDSKLFVKAKNNLAPDKNALRYGFGVKTVGHDQKLGANIDAPYIVWHPQYVEITANEAMQATQGKTAKREAREFLLERLQAGPVNSDDLIEEAKQEGIAKRTLDRAKKDLGIKSRKQRGKTDGPWFWELPPKRESWQPS